MATDPLFGRKTWQYVQVVRGPVAGPQPRLARGTARTGKPSYPGTGPQLPAYVSDNDYRPSPFTYQPVRNRPFRFIGPHTVHTETEASQLESTFSSVPGDTYEKNIPQTIGVGTNGRALVGTYEPHANLVGQRFNHQMRSAPSWQMQAYPPDFRNTIQWQQVMRYRPKSNTLSARPLTANNYFLGYTIQSEVQGQIGQNTLGYMGSV
jgi:hypothetical protein